MIPKKINIAIAGFGNIGSYFYKILEKNKKTITVKTGKTPVVKYISAKNLNKKRNIKGKKKSLAEKDKDYDLAEQDRIEKMKKIKEQIELAKQARLDEKKSTNDIWKQEKKTSKKKILKTEKVPSKKEVVINTGIAKIDISSTEFKKLVEKITKKNMFRSYPNINDIPK